MNIDEARAALSQEIALRQHYQEEARRLKAEIEKMRKQYFVIPARANGKSTLVRMTLKSVADEAIKKFVEKLKESAFDVDVSFGYGKECYDKAVAVIEIDNLVKEMEREDNA